MHTSQHRSFRKLTLELLKGLLLPVPDPLCPAKEHPLKYKSVTFAYTSYSLVGQNKNIKTECKTFKYIEIQLLRLKLDDHDGPVALFYSPGS